MAKNRSARPARPSDKAIERQTSYDTIAKTFTARCGICGSEKSQKRKWYHSRDKTIRLLRLMFNYCHDCDRWVCTDCYFVDDGKGYGIGICRECGEKQGIKGLTVAEAEAAIRKRMIVTSDTMDGGNI